LEESLESPFYEVVILPIFIGAGEAAFRELKDQLKLGPIYHWTEVRVERCAELRSAALLRAHVAVCFLAFLLEVELKRRLREQGVGASFREVLSDLKRVKAVHLEVKGEEYLARTELSGQAYQGFRAAAMVVPPRVVALQWIRPLIAPEMLAPRQIPISRCQTQL